MADRSRALKVLAKAIADAIWEHDVKQASSPPAAGDEECLQSAGTPGGSHDPHKP